MSYSVGQVAAFAKVTVRTLHHYDEVGLLAPGERSLSGYRKYLDTDLQRLQQILFYRELGFPLEEIAAIMDDPETDTSTHLRRQRRLLKGKIERLQEMVTAVEYTMEAHIMGISLTPEEQFEVFGDFRPQDHAEEVEQRWGGTDAYRQSQRRTASYTKQDWERVMAEAAETVRRLVEAKDAGIDPASEQVMALAEEHRQHITRWFYDCSYEIHRGLGQMYVDDPRFTATYEGFSPGLARYVCGAIGANADRAAAN